MHEFEAKLLLLFLFFFQSFTAASSYISCNMDTPAYYPP